MRRGFFVYLLIAATFVSTAESGAAEAPEVVSPGSTVVSLKVTTSCPTFSWSGLAHADRYELVLYRLLEDARLEESLSLEVPGGATTWTPSAPLCLQSDSRYAWTVRGFFEDKPGPWSEAMLFETAGRPSDEDVREALAVLERYRDGIQGDRARKSIAAPESNASREALPVPSGGRKSLHDARIEGVPRTPSAVSPPFSYSLKLDGSIDMDGYLFHRGTSFMHVDGGSAGGNTAVGLYALSNLTIGTPNGWSGRDNTAMGYQALLFNTEGNGNTAFGRRALESNISGQVNTGLGSRTLLSNITGSKNVAVGSQALEANTTGHSNTAVGRLSMFDGTTGSYNTAIGNDAGRNWTTGSDNIAVGMGSHGKPGESGTIRIGGGGRQQQTFIEGIRGATGAPAFDEAVCVNTLDQLGPCTPSTRRLKHGVAPMGATAEMLRALRPVRFRYKTLSEHGLDSRIQYGLIAEEVAEVLPSLVSYDDAGRPFTIRYSLLVPLLLNELQRLDKTLETLRAASAFKD